MSSFKRYTFSFDATRTEILANSRSQAILLYKDYMKEHPIRQVGGDLLYQWDSTFSEDIRIHEQDLFIGVVSHESH